MRRGHVANPERSGSWAVDICLRVPRTTRTLFCDRIDKYHRLAWIAMKAAHGIGIQLSVKPPCRPLVAPAPVLTVIIAYVQLQENETDTYYVSGGCIFGPVLVGLDFE